MELNKDNVELLVKSDTAPRVKVYFDKKTKILPNDFEMKIGDWIVINYRMKSKNKPYAVDIKKK